jgi:hypothetical protein
MRLELSLVNLTHKKRKESASPVSQVIQITLIQGSGIGIRIWEGQKPAENRKTDDLYGL